MRLIALAALLVAATTGLSGCEKASDAAFGARVRSYLLAHPEIIEEAAQKLEANRANVQAQKTSSQNIAIHRERLERDKRDYVANPNGKITVVEFFDYRCGYCKKAAPEVVQLIAANPDVRFVFKELPIFGGESDRAAALALAAKADGKYLSVYQGFFSTNALDDAGMQRILAGAGLDPKKVQTSAQTAAIQQHLIDNHKLASDLGVDGTPMFFVGDTAVVGADFPSLNAAIAKARRAGAT